ncbi:hypothetical protein [Streptomyces xanthophaeus]|uniref:hypothetical protein n=1 Tax=Streptomyces xanthophaeus TaxID=67385 RepID=UPI002648C6CD|nr:hypothetical protein [Streptomyces xanthophaeus]WKD36501.1 hypothetical protein KO717_34260 [Streptomyces xanthophaeus]
MTARKTVSSETESFDAFWASVARPTTTIIRGVTVAVPRDMPMLVEQRVEELQDSSSIDDIAELVGMIFGDDCLEKWRDAGMGLLEFQVVLAWGMANARGRETSYQEAFEMVQEQAAEGKAPAPNRAARRSRSAGTGGPSKRISSGSTGSARKTSR